MQNGHYYITNAYGGTVHPTDAVLTGFGDTPSKHSSISSTVRRQKEYSLFTKCVAEFIGDVIFVFCGTMQAYVHGTNDNLVHAALTHGIAIFVLAAGLGHISGGHFNPAVSWGIVISGKMPIFHFPCYVICQLLGGFCGALLSTVLQRSITMAVILPPVSTNLNASEIVMTYNGVGNYTTVNSILTKSQLDITYAGATLLNPDNKWWEGLISETMVTYMLVHTILLTAVDTDKNILAPLAIGLTLTIDIFATGVITGASMNPARSLGPNIVGSIFCEQLPPGYWSQHYIYWAGPFLGATIAAALHKFVSQL